MAKILLVDDDADLARVAKELLEMEHHLVELAHNGVAAMELLGVAVYDVIILDWNMPEMDGMEVLRRYRAKGGSTPVLMLTGKGAITDRTSGLDSGADDYLTKPFDHRELSARVRSLLRRPSSRTSNILSVGVLTLEPTKYRVTKNGQELTLLPKEFALLEFLMRHPDEVFNAEAILDRVWSTDAEVTPETVRTCVKRLRKKLDPDADPDNSVIQTLHGVGYRLRSSV